MKMHVLVVSWLSMLLHRDVLNYEENVNITYIRIDSNIYTVRYNISISIYQITNN